MQRSNLTELKDKKKNQIKQKSQTLQWNSSQQF